ncbi:MAG: cytochrome c biogenesis protein DipZ [Solirubrobacteraceae bacterium]
MLLLTLFAVLAGAGTALSPCVLPVLPALLSAGAVGGHRRPLGIVLGLSVTFTVTIVGVAKVVDGVGLGAGALRNLAVLVLLLFGLALLVPALAARVEAPLSRLARLGPKSRGDGFRSGLLVGAALGFVYTPCAGPILAAVISVGAATGKTVVIAIAYAAGSAVVLLLLSLGGRRVLQRLRRTGQGQNLQRVLGVVMLATAVAIVAKVDVSFDQFIARHIPDVNLAAGLERSAAVGSRLTAITGRSKFDSSRVLNAAATQTPVTASGVSGGQTPGLPVLGVAPNFVDNQRWFNTPGDRPLTLAGLRGRVVLIDFWTYTCINCLRTLPYLEAWDAKYRSQGLTIVGVHSPEFSFEHVAGNVADAISRLGVRYPVAQDNNLSTWNAWGNQYWPAEYLIDARGRVRHTHFGEGEYGQTEAAIRSLLREAGKRNLGTTAKPRGTVSVSNQATPETYLGSARAQGWVPSLPRPGVHGYPRAPRSLPLNGFAYSGTWGITPESATAIGSAGIDAELLAKNVYLVLSSTNAAPRDVSVLLDGRPISLSAAGSDVRRSTVTVTGQRLYTLVSLKRAEQHRLSLRFSPGVSGYAFTFG